jgi:apolipoprotein N-acyltransferase
LASLWGGRKPLVQLLLLALAGVGMGLGAAPLNFWWLAWIALVPLWLAVRQAQDWRWAGLIGLVWGCGYHGYSLFWLTGLHPLTWMGLSWWNSVAIATSCWLFVTVWGALIPGLWAVGMTLGRQLSRHWGDWRQLWLGVALWCGLEGLWSQSFLWWTSLTLTQSDGNRVLLHLGRLSGPTTTVAVIVAVNGVLALAWSAWRKSQPHSQRQGLSWRLGWRGYVGIGFTILVAAHLLGWSLYRQPLPDLAQPQTLATTLKVGVIQGNIPTRVKLYPQGLAMAMQNYTQGYQELATAGAQAILTPEAALPMAFLGSEQTRSQTPFWQALRAQPLVTWLGSFAQTPDGLNRTQSLLTLGAEGEVISRYDKIKLAPLAEYIPLQESLGQWIERMSPIKSSMVPGQESQQVDTPVGKAIVGICYDSAFSQIFRRQASTGGEFMITASNNDPYSTRMMLQHHAQDIQRAIETDRWAVRATNTGYSAVVNPHGETVWHAQPNTYSTHIEMIQRRQTQTLYVRWGDWLLWVLLLGAVGVLVI